MQILLWILPCLARLAAGHSWIDSLTDGTTTGYIRGYQGHIDSVSTYQLLQAADSAPLCKSNQQSSDAYTSQYPRLTAKAGDVITAEYLENGHVSKDKLPPDNLPHPGSYTWFWTGDPSIQLTTLGDLANAKVLAGPLSFDDGRCAVDSANTLGRKGPIPCHGSFSIPANTATGLYQVVWVWDFPKIPKSIDPTYSDFYTSCMDIFVAGGDGSANTADTDTSLEPTSSTSRELLLATDIQAPPPSFTSTVTVMATDIETATPTPLSILSTEIVIITDIETVTPSATLDAISVDALTPVIDTPASSTQTTTVVRLVSPIAQEVFATTATFAGSTLTEVVEGTVFTTFDGGDSSSTLTIHDTTRETLATSTSRQHSAPRPKSARGSTHSKPTISSQHTTPSEPNPSTTHHLSTTTVHAYSTVESTVTVYTAIYIIMPDTTTNQVDRALAAQTVPNISSSLPSSRSQGLTIPVSATIPMSFKTMTVYQQAKTTIDSKSSTDT